MEDSSEAVDLENRRNTEEDAYYARRQIDQLLDSSRLYLNEDLILNHIDYFVSKSRGNETRGSHRYPLRILGCVVFCSGNTASSRIDQTFESSPIYTIGG
jgi:hypothetical protein